MRVRLGFPAKQVVTKPLESGTSEVAEGRNRERQRGGNPAGSGREIEDRAVAHSGQCDLEAALSFACPSSIAAAAMSVITLVHAVRSLVEGTLRLEESVRTPEVVPQARKALTVAQGSGRAAELLEAWRLVIRIPL